MVPGSTLIYGSSFCMRTRRPRFSSNRPIAAAVSPLPSELTTPPVTKMCLVMTPQVLQRTDVNSGSAGEYVRPGILPEARDKSSIVFRSVNSNGSPLHDPDANGCSGFQGPQLFQLLQSFQPADGQLRQFHQEIS